jgi:uncharacterized protein (DUF2252 family)
MNIVQSTRRYESWLRGQTPIVAKDLKAKHEMMQISPFVFLRATFYRWIQLWPDICKKVADAPRVLAVGDLHLENFGTWRDAEGRLVWGVNDFDEAYLLPYTNDLVRLATSAILAIKEEQLEVSPRTACTAILEGYAAGMERGGRPIVLAERNRWLRELAIQQLRDPAKFWKKLWKNETAKEPIPHTALRLLLPAPRLRHRVVVRQAGVGSLGRPRYVALPDWAGGRIAREVKALAPSAAAWASGDAADTNYCSDAVTHAVRSADPFFSVLDYWVVRRLAPDCTKIEIDQLPNAGDEAKLLRAMGWETANVHLGRRGVQILRDLKSRSGRWLERAAGRMAEATTEDWRAWKRR